LIKTTTRGLAALLMLAVACFTAVPGLTEETDRTPGPPGFSPQTGPAAAAATDSAKIDTPLEITIGDAILTALQNNRALRVERLNPAIRETYEQEEAARFDPALAAELSAARERVKAESRTTGTIADTSEGRTGAGLSLSRFLPTGTEFSVGLTTDLDWSELYSDQYATRLGLTVTQSLLRGAGREFNLASVRQARLDTLSSRHELRGFTESLVAEVETTYWNYALARLQIQIYQKSADLAEQQLKEVEDRIEVGKLAEIELAAAQAELALRKEALINAQSNLDALRLRLARLLNPGRGGAWNGPIILKNQPAVPEVKLDDLESHCAVALRLRPDLNQARLEVLRGELEIVKTKNGLLPRMDLFINLGKSGYAGSFGGSLEDLGGRSYDISAGISLELPPGNRAAESRHRRAVLNHDQAGEALENLAQLAELDVRLAYLEVNRAAQQIKATVATRRFQEEKLRAETEKFRVGRSTPLMVAQAQRDLVDSQISEIKAIVNHLNSLVELFRVEGSLLERRGISTD